MHEKGQTDKQIEDIIKVREIGGCIFHIKMKIILANKFPNNLHLITSSDMRYDCLGLNV